jgi:anti-sigma factor RsiW
MELMLYVDGELDEARRAEIEAHLAQSESGRRKVAALRIGSGMVREHSLASAKDFDIASAVMAKIDAIAVDLPAENLPAKSPPAKKESAGADVIALRDRRPAAADRSKAANDNSRGIFTLAAIAVAAAAGLMIWGQMGAGPGRSADSAPVTAQEAPAIPAPAEKPVAPPTEAASAESEEEHGVEVAAVDFGAHMGTIFYVPTDAVAGATTTVVWVDDEVAGGQ